jgi:hypothetical protein
VVVRRVKQFLQRADHPLRWLRTTRLDNGRSENVRFTLAILRKLFWRTGRDVVSRGPDEVQFKLRN